MYSYTKNGKNYLFISGAPTSNSPESTDLNYYKMGNGAYLGKASGLHSAANQSQYTNYSQALGSTYNIGEYIPFYHNSYNLSSAAGRMQYAADRAEAENVRRYYEILSGYQRLLNNGVSSVQSAYNKAFTTNLQNLTSRGLTGTTILANAQAQNAINAANATTAQYNANLQNMLEFMERRNTSYGGTR